MIVYAAGSLRRALNPLLARFQARTGLSVSVQYGPAGLLRERIEAGEPCDLFASANTAHPQILLDAGRAFRVQTFAFNRLNLTARAGLSGSWLTLLADPALRLGTSTPGCDPSGDYTWQLFARIDAQLPGTGAAIRERAQPLVGGRQSPPVPEGEVASAWLIRSQQADLFIGYAHYAQALKEAEDLRVVDIPTPYNPHCEYQLACLSHTPAVQGLAQFMLAAEGQAFFREAGLLTLDGE